MIINLNQILFCISYALDCVEKQLVGVTTGHSKRVAYVCAVMGKNLGLTNKEIADLAGCAAMHDNALSEYLKCEFNGKSNNFNNNKELGIHCIIGEENIKEFPFETNVKGAILYHHENADGSGPFGKKENETPIMAQIIHFADKLDADCDLSNICDSSFETVTEYLNKNKGTLFQPNLVDVFNRCFTKQMLLNLEVKNLDALLNTVVTNSVKYYESKEIVKMTDVFAKIIDYKSSFTKNHSLGVAKKAMQMAQYYGYDDDTVNKLYIAGALHDIGKLAIDNDVLEKPDRLTSDEYKYMKDHAYYTHEILTKIDGFGDIAMWASNHHEKLNGSGYPFGKTADELTKNDRLLACIDIYQALTEDRPYKKGMSHKKVMEILLKMVDDYLIDGNIVKDINTVFG